MTDRWALALAASAAIGALHPGEAPLAVGLLATVAALAARRPGLLCLSLAVLVSTLSGRSLAGLDGVVDAPVAGVVTLLTDPTPSFGGVRADARWHGRRVELRADGSSAVAIRARLAGERISVRGRLAPVPTDEPWLVARHIAGRLRVFAVDGWQPGGLASRGANALRRTLEVGATPLDPSARSLYTGLVIGDDRSQPDALADDFLGAGLTHLLAVSGQNVAFVLAATGPVLRRVRLWPRLMLTLGVIAMFAVVTRFEPSVVRASAMAALAAAALTGGGPVSRARVLALAVTGLLLLDPLLVRSVGFQLSTAATGAIVLAAPRLVAALPGPAAVREALSVTIAAQLGVAPVLLAVFGPFPVASLPANLLAVPVAGAVMVWGLTGGLLGGVVGGPVAAVLHLPTSIALTWIAGVAHRAAAAPLGTIGPAHALGVALGLALSMWAGPPRGASRPFRDRARCAGLAVAVATIGAAVISAQAAPPLRSALAVGIVRWHHDSTEVVVLGGAGGRAPLGGASTLAFLRTAGVGAIDLLVVADASVPASVVATIAERHRIGAVLLGGGAGPVVARARIIVAPRPKAVLDVGSLHLRLVSTADRLVVDVTPRAPPDGSAWRPR